MRYVYDHAYDARGFFDPMLTAAGWWDDEFSQIDGEVAPPAPVEFIPYVGFSIDMGLLGKFST